MKLFVFVLVLSVAAFFIWGDPVGLMQRVSQWACEWLSLAKAC